MNRLNLTSLSIADAKLVQHGLKALGYYNGTTRGLPGPKTAAAYEKFLKDNSDDIDEAQAFVEVVLANEDKTDAQALVDAFVDVLVSKNGVREVPKNSNRGPDVEQFQRATWLEGTGWAWCAAFVCWGFKRLVDSGIDLRFARPQTAGAWDFERWARSQPSPVKLHKPRTKIKKGDIVIFTFSHIGVAIEDEAGGYVKTIEGNTDSSGSREGGGVYIKTRATSLIRSNIRWTD